MKVSFDFFIRFSILFFSLLQVSNNIKSWLLHKIKNELKFSNIKHGKVFFNIFPQLVWATFSQSGEKYMIHHFIMKKTKHQVDEFRNLFLRKFVLSYSHHALRMMRKMKIVYYIKFSLKTFYPFFYFFSSEKFCSFSLCCVLRNENYDDEEKKTRKHKNQKHKKCCFLEKNVAVVLWRSFEETFSVSSC